MGNKQSRTLVTFLDSRNINAVVKDATEAIKEGNSAMIQKEFQEAYTAYRFACALLDLCINYEGVSKKKKETLTDINLDIKFKLQDLQAVIELDHDRLLRAKKKNNTESSSLDKDKLKLPPHITEELANAKKNAKDLSEEAMAYKKILDTIEICRPNLPMSEVIGQKEAIEMLEDTLVDRHIRPDLFQATHCKGALLYGPPGNGKTTIAKALATVVANASKGNMPFFKVTTANFKSKWSGQAEITLTAIFKLAHMNGPAIMFIDEVEQLFASRSDGVDSSGTGTVQLFLDLMSTYKEVFFIGATNFPWYIDEALLRRMCPTYIRMPTREDRLSLVKKLFSNVDHFILQKDFNNIADNTEGFSFDDIYNLKEAVTKKVLKATRHCKYFKHTTQEGYQISWTPCMEYEEGAKLKNYRSILNSKDGLVFPTVTKDLVEACITLQTPTVSKETIEYNDLFFEKGSTAVMERIEAKTKAKKTQQ